MVSSTLQSGNQDLDLIFRALGDPTRRDLLARLSGGPARVTELAKPIDMSLAAVGKHLRVLEKAGLITRTIKGREHECALHAKPLRDANDWLLRYQRFWSESLESLDIYVQDKSRQKRRTKKSSR